MKTNMTFNHLPEHRVLLSETEINLCVRQIAERINHDYEGKKVVLVGILEGCRPFLNALKSHLTIDFEETLLKVSFYGDSFSPAEHPQLNVDIDSAYKSVANQHILLVDDLLDSGKTMHWLQLWMEHQFSPLSLKTCTLLNRDIPNKHSFADYTGYTFSGEDWVIGFGLDPHRELPYLALIPPQIT